MPPIVALLGCSAFVFIMLRIERRESVGVTSFLWIPTLWFLITFSRPLSLWLGVGASSIEAGNPADQVLLLTLFGIALVVLARRQFSLSSALQRNPWIAMLLGFSLLSVLWSQMPFISFRRWATAGIAVVMIFSVHSEPNPRAAVESVLRRVVYICVPLSYVLIHYYSQYGVIYVHNAGDKMWTGVSLHKNSLAQLILLSVLYLTWRIVGSFRRRGKSRLEKLGLWGDIAVLVITIVISMGRTRKRHHKHSE